MPSQMVGVGCEFGDRKGFMGGGWVCVQWKRFFDVYARTETFLY